MKITSLDVLQADAGWRLFSFVKITTDSGIVGWSEYNESFGSAGLGDVIRALSPLVVGQDPMRSEFVLAHLHTSTRQSRGGLNHQAIAAIENALLDVRGKALGVPVYALFGGPVRERIPVYWSHFGTYRVSHGEFVGAPIPRNYDDLARQAAEVKALGFRALKTNFLPFGGDRLLPFNPGFGRTPGHPELNWDNALLRGVSEQLGAIRGAVGPDMGLMLDINFHFKTEGFRRVAHAVTPFDLTWLEMDTHDAPSLALIRRGAPCPIAARDAGRPARLQDVFRGLCDGHGHRGRRLERTRRIAEDRLHGRSLRDERGAPQFLRSPVDDHQRPLRRRSAEPADHGGRPRQRLLARRVLHLGARH
jgi:galactonate dehydratase